MIKTPEQLKEEVMIEVRKMAHTIDTLRWENQILKNENGYLKRDNIDLERRLSAFNDSY